MFYLLLASGAAFVAAGAVVAAQARVVESGVPIPRPALALFAGFAVARGASYWAEMASLADGPARGAGVETAATVHVVLIAASFSLLLGFAIAVRRPDEPRSSLVPAIAISALAAWGISLAALLEADHVTGHTAAPATVLIFTRWLLGLPAGIAAAIGLLAHARSVELESWVESRLVRAAGIVFVVHAAADALDGLAGVLQATTLSGAALAPGLQLSLEIFETGSAAAIAVLLSEAFVFETSQRFRREETHLRDGFITLVAHELGNPVAALELASERLDMSRRAGRAVDPRLSGDVKACALTLRRLVMDLLDTSRIHAWRLETDPVIVDLRPILERAGEVASAQDPERPPVTVDCPADLPHAVADPARLDQILGNLLTNASKYSAPGSPVRVAAEARNGKVTLRVVNEGLTIAAGEAFRIFSRDCRGYAAIGGTAHGLGLGLYMARALVEAQGGRIWVDSRDGRTAFCFTLPAAPALAEASLVPTGDRAAAVH